jgi:hypothetical protein
MRVISATILDPTHLELSQPLEGAPGAVIQITLPSETDEEMNLWHQASMQQLLSAYSDEDAVYDEL